MFTAEDGTNGRELWISDGTAAGTSLVKDITPGKEGIKPPHWLLRPRHSALEIRVQRL
ncbi:MAG: hypothetical protein R3F30_14540 [Planctomycetota bacterium]